jgi:O-antigen ligase/polysaccharide polymerase Wzy-like membrane protein
VAASNAHALGPEALCVLGLMAGDEAARHRDDPVPREAVAPRHDGPHGARGAGAPGLLGDGGVCGDRAARDRPHDLLDARLELRARRDDPEADRCLHASTLDFAAMRPSRLDWLLLATLVVPTWEKIRWETSAASLTITNLIATAFIIVFVADRLARRDAQVPSVSIALIGFMFAFGAVYLAGYFDLRDHDALTFWVKGIVTWSVHFAFLVCACAHVVRRGRPLFLRCVWAFVAGLIVNCVYGIFQLALQVGAGVNLDTLVVGPLTAGQGKQGGIGVFGQVAGQTTVYRINALTGDPNHLGVMLCVPIFVLLAWYLLDRRARRWAAATLVLMLVVQTLTLSRSAALGDVVGLAVLLPGLRGHLPSTRRLAIGAGAVVGAAAVVYASSSFVQTVISARTQLSGSGVLTHLQFYQLVPPALDPNPLFGMGFNTFAVFYQFLTGRTDYGPHSAWVATLVETGVVGFALYLAYFAWLVASALRVRLAADPDISRIGWGIAAALAGTAAANFFYLTMTLEYFFVVALLAVAGTALFAPEPVPAPRVASVGSAA